MADIFCPSFNDAISLWPTTKNGSWAEVPCPKHPAFSKGVSVKRLCSGVGLWLGKNGTPVVNLTDSFVDYKVCLQDHSLGVFNIEEGHFKLLKDISRIGAAIGLVGCVLSLISLALAIFLYTKYRCLKNYRTKIHRHLFLAVLFECVIKIVLITDAQHFSVSSSQISDNSTLSIRKGSLQASTPILCNVMISIWEYCQTCVFMWMLVEGIHIHNIIAVNVFPTKQGIWPYFILAWIFPALLTGCWAMVNIFSPKIPTCWFGYHQSSFFWILNSFRLAACVTNMAFLLNVIRVLVFRLQANNRPEVQQVRKAMKAAVLLLPLLGITNFVIIIPSPFDDIGKYIFLEILKSILPNYIGLSVAILYCFMSKDVQMCIRRSLVRRQMRNGNYEAANSAILTTTRNRSILTTVTAGNELPIGQIGTNGRSNQIELHNLQKDSNTVEDNINLNENQNEKIF